MTKTFRLTHLQDAVQIATTLTKSWFRGHSRVVGQLVPRLFRRHYHNPIRRAFQPELELSTIEAFKRRAPLVSALRLPPDRDRFGWLCVMQHYRTPTRLLDWTENALVALYFAVCGDHEVDGELWAMLPWALNAQAGAGWGTPLVSESPHVKYLLAEPYWAGKPGELAEKFGLKEPVRSAIAVEPPLFFPRMAVQSSTFTVHPSPDKSKSIADALPDPRHLVRYVVPASAKPELLSGLRVLGVTESQLFPDLEGLSRMIVASHQTVAYGPPSPPVCSGEVSEETGGSR